ncbi:MAG: hypothetical protein JWQ40_457 [Segetibacter sp.]|nr:hypothetical protein [Segetibacter sp.]
MKTLLAALLLFSALQSTAQLTKEEKEVIENIQKQIPHTLQMLLVILFKC